MKIITQLMQRHVYAVLVALSLLAVNSSAQTVSTPFPRPITANGTNIGTVNCAFTAQFAITGTCNVNITAASWCVTSLSTSAAPSVPPTARSSSSGGGTVPANCVKTAAVPFTLTSLCTSPQLPYNVGLQGNAYSTNAPKPVCKGPHVHHKSVEEENRCNDKTHHHHDDDCEEDGSSDHSKSKHSHMDDKSYENKYGKKFSGTKTHKDGICEGHDENEHEHHHHGGGGSGGGGGGTTGPVMFNVSGQLPCQTPPPT
jgi:hypothetical protein